MDNLSLNDVSHTFFRHSGAPAHNTTETQLLNENFFLWGDGKGKLHKNTAGSAGQKIKVRNS